MVTEKNSVWNIICNIFEELNIFDMTNYSRVILNRNGKDIGLREDNRGAIFIEPKIYFKNAKIQKLIKAVSSSNIVKREISKK